MSDEEKHRLIITIWSEAKAKIETLVRESYHPGNNIFNMVDSGARGTWGQMTQMAGMKGLVASPSGEIIELPIKSSLLEGFSPIEYFISAHGARKGKADTALRTAESGYLTRRLVDATQEVIVREEDCGGSEFIIISKDEAETRGEGFDELIFGRTLATDVEDKKGNIILQAGALIEKENLRTIMDADIEVINVRSALTCHTIS